MVIDPPAAGGRKLLLLCLQNLRNINMYQIGEFSRITELPVKTLRYYHEQGLLEPAHVDSQTGYRYYDDENVERARMIKQLRQLEFPLANIVEILRFEGDILDLLEQQKLSLQTEVDRLADVNAKLDQIILIERNARKMMSESNFEIKEKELEPMLVGGVRMKGKYSECGKGFSKLGKTFGRHIRGPAFLLHYDTEYREDDANFEACMPIAKGESKDDINVRTLDGGRCVTLLHKGPYDTISRSYEKIIRYVNEKEYEIMSPTREVYIKGPGMIFTGNPKKYLTEIQMLIDQ